MQNNLDTLSGTNQVEAMGYESTVRMLENELRDFLRSVNQSRLFEEEITATAHPTREQQTQLEQILNQLDTIGLNLRDFDDFHTWQKYWLPLSPPEQKVILALTSVKPNDWVVAFQSWYLQQFLSQYHHEVKMAPRVIGFTSSRSSFSTTAYTLLDSLIDQDTQEIDLLYHHRPGPAAITDLYYQKFKSINDLHFYNKTKDKNAITNIPLDLSYRSDQSTKTHYAEVLENILKEIEPVSKNYQYPTLKIVVEEEALRNFLFYRLYHKRVGHTPMADQLQKLFPKGIQIHASENQESETTDYLLYIQSPESPQSNTRALQNQLGHTKQKVFFIHSDQVASWERKYRALLTFYGLEYVYVWSADWWKNESGAIAALVNKIEERTAQYVG